MPHPELRLTSRAALAAAVLAALVVGCGDPVPRERIESALQREGPPHLVLVVVDTLRADWTTPYGDPHGTTPELERWASRGVVFERAIAQSSWTKMSMASLLTSLWPRSHGIRLGTDGLAEDARTLAEILQERGYATYGVQTNGWLDQSFGFEQGFDRYLFPRAGGAPTLDRAALWPHADRVLEEARRVLAHHDPERPLFLYLHFMDVHEYAAPPEHRVFGSDARGDYRAAIRWVDATLARLRESLARRGYLDEAVLVFASDHGEAFGENGTTGHAKNVLRAVVHVPLVLRLPFPVEPQRVRARVRNLDIAPTLLDLAGLAPPEAFEGRSLLPLVTGETPPEDRPAFAALGERLFPGAAVQQSVFLGPWTYARNLGEPGSEAVEEELLFHRPTDPGENVDLSSRESERLEALREVLERHRSAGDREAARAEDVRIDPGIAERLRAMGYLR